MIRIKHGLKIGIMLLFVFVLFDAAAVFVLRNTHNTDFITRCLDNPAGSIARRQCVLGWFQKNAPNLPLKDAMEIIDTRHEAGKMSLRACHLWKHNAVNAVFALQDIDIKNALEVCSQERELCDGGCFHTTMEQAVKRSGITDEALTSFEQLCLGLKQERPILECIHGIGHGLALSINHTFDLVSALESCKRSVMSSPQLQYACYTGVFMVSTRPDMGMDMKHMYFDAKDPFYPCETVPKEYKEACYSEMPSRVYAAGGSFSDALAACQKLTSDEWAKACRVQIHRNVAREPMPAIEKQKVCLSMGEYARDCFAMVSWDMIGMADSTYTKLSEFCAGLTGENAKACHINRL